MPLEPHKHKTSKVLLIKGWVEFEGARIAGPHALGRAPQTGLLSLRPDPRWQAFKPPLTTDIENERDHPAGTLKPIARPTSGDIEP